MRCCLSSLGLESFVKVNIIVEDVNDNPPELIAEDIHLCDSDNTGTVRDTVTVFTYYTVGYHGIIDVFCFF